MEKSIVNYFSDESLLESNVKLTDCLVIIRRKQVDAVVEIDGIRFRTPEEDFYFQIELPPSCFFDFVRRIMEDSDRVVKAVIQLQIKLHLILN